MLSGVTCAACGARIRTDRAHCLRCGEPLVAVVDAAPVQKLTKGQQLTAAAVGSLVLLVVLALLGGSRASVDQGMMPTSTVGAASTAPSAAPNTAATQSPEGFDASRGAFLDLSRAGTGAFATGNFVDARQQYEAALAERPDDPEVLNALGLSLERLSDFPGAIARFERAVELAPDKWQYHFNLAHAAGQLSQWDRSIAEYREAARLFPEDYATQFNLAMVLHRQGNDAEAIPAFQKAIVLAPSEPSFHIALGNSYQKVGRLADAQREFEAYLELEPDAADAGSVRAHIQSLAAAAKAAAMPSPAAAATPPPVVETGGSPALP